MTQQYILKYTYSNNISPNLDLTPFTIAYSITHGNIILFGDIISFRDLVTLDEYWRTASSMDRFL